MGIRGHESGAESGILDSGFEHLADRRFEMAKLKRQMRNGRFEMGKDRADGRDLIANPKSKISNCKSQIANHKSLNGPMTR